MGPALDQTPAFTTKAVRDASAERIFAQVDRLAPMPTIVAEVMRITDDPESNMRDLEDSISRDPVVAARVFKIANSSFYCRGALARTLTDALTRVGMRSVRTLVMAASAGQVLDAHDRGYGYAFNGLWRHSLAMGLASRMVASEVGLSRSEQEEIFLDGLVHDIGKLVLGPLFEGLVNSTGLLALEAEAAQLGITHVEAGAAVATHWNLPAHARDTIAYHHQLTRNAIAERHVASVHLADYVLNRANVGLAEGVVVDDHLDSSALECLSLNETTFSELEMTVRNNVAQSNNECRQLM